MTHLHIKVAEVIEVISANSMVSVSCIYGLTIVAEMQTLNSYSLPLVKNIAVQILKKAGDAIIDQDKKMRRPFIRAQVYLHIDRIVLLCLQSRISSHLCAMNKL